MNENVCLIREVEIFIWKGFNDYRKKGIELWSKEPSKQCSKLLIKDSKETKSNHCAINVQLEK